MEHGFGPKQVTEEKASADTAYQLEHNSVVCAS
jgi:hypothetical protein